MKPIDTTAYYKASAVRQRVLADLTLIPGVTAVGVGPKVVGNEETEDVAIRVFVEKKGRFTPKNEIPARIAGVLTDVEECVFLHSGSAVAPAPVAIDLPNITRYDPIKGGCSIGPVREVSPGSVSAGTCGVVVEDTADDNKRRLLSNYHVMCLDGAWDAPGADRRIVQPGRLDGGVAGVDTVGEIVRGFYGSVPSGLLNNYIDAAICDLGAGREASPEILEIGALAGSNAAPVVNAAVKKSGRTTGLTSGVLLDTDFVTRVGATWFYHQYMVSSDPATQPDFSGLGDSGSIVVGTADTKAVGMIMSIGISATGRSYTVCNPISMVEESLEVRLVTG